MTDDTNPIPEAPAPPWPEVVPPGAEVEWEGMPEASQRPGEGIEVYGSTPVWGMPYPEPTEPVAQGAAAIRALAERDAYWLTLINDRFRASAGRAYPPAAANSGSWVALNFAPMFDDWNMYAGAARVNLYPPGGYVRTFWHVDAWFSGGTGTGACSIRIARYSGASALLDVATQVDGPLNAHIAMAGFVSSGPGEFIQIQHLASATGSGHSVDGRVVTTVHQPM